MLYPVQGQGALEICLCHGSIGIICEGDVGVILILGVVVFYILDPVGGRCGQNPDDPGGCPMLGCLEMS